jgi:hypothetical protein
LPLLPFTGIPAARPGRITLFGHQLLGDPWHQLRLEIGLLRGLRVVRRVIFFPASRGVFNPR